MALNLRLSMINELIHVKHLAESTFILVMYLVSCNCWLTMDTKVGQNHETIL